MLRKLNAARSVLLTLCAVVAVDCGGNLAAPQATSLGSSTAGDASDGLVTVSAAAKKTRAVLNSARKVTGIAYLDVGGTHYDVTFSDGGLSYNQAIGTLTKKTSTAFFSNAAAALTAAEAIRTFFNASIPPITADDIAWDSVSDTDGRGDVVVPYSVTATDVPFAASGWNSTQLLWALPGTFSFERDRPLQSASAWVFFSPVRSGH